VADDQPHAVFQLTPRRLPPLAATGLGRADEDEGDGGTQKRDGVEEDGHRGGEELNQDASKSRTGDLRHGIAHLKHAVRRRQLFAGHHAGQKRHVRDLEEQLERAEHETDHVQMGELEGSADRKEWDQREEPGPSYIRRDQDRTPG
jgi:hypothetical protein